MGDIERKGYLLTVEGTEGTGKTTLIRRIKHYLEGKGFLVSFYREPGSTPAGERIRRILLKIPLSPLTEALLYLAARHELVSKRIEKDLREGKIVLVDRFMDSTLAYQGYGRGLDLEWLEEMNHLVTREIEPDLTLLLISSSPLGFKKVGKDKIERESYEFHRKVREGYEEIERKYRHRIRRIKLEGDREEVFLRVKKILDKEVIPCLRERS